MFRASMSHAEYTRKGIFGEEKSSKESSPGKDAVDNNDDEEMTRELSVDELMIDDQTRVKV